MFRATLQSTKSGEVLQEMIINRRGGNKYRFVYRSDLKKSFPLEVYPDCISLEARRFCKKDPLHYLFEETLLKLNKPLDEDPPPAAPVTTAPPRPLLETSRERPPFYLWQTAPSFSPINKRPDQYRFLIDSMRSWKALTPEPKRMRILDENCEAMINDLNVPKITYAYNNLRPRAFKTDLWRLAALYKFGGVYSDLHFMCADPKALSALLEEFDYVLCVKGTKIHNGWIFVKHPESPFIWRCIEKITENVYRKMWYTDPTAFTGGGLIAEVLHEGGGLSAITSSNSVLDIEGERFALLRYRHLGSHAQELRFEERTLLSCEYPNYRHDMRCLGAEPHFIRFHKTRHIYD